MFTDRETQIKEVTEIFADAKSEEGWNVEGEMLYSFYFVDESIEKLEKLAEHFEKESYDSINIYELGDEETQKPTGEFMLHLDKTEAHTPETLVTRNEEFFKIADEYEVEYDGWEFGEEDDFEDEDDEE